MLKICIRLGYKLAFRLWRLYLSVFSVETFGAQVIVLVNDKVLLVKSCYRNFYCFPGGYRQKEESAIDNALRELNEETGIVLASEQLKLYMVHCFKKGRSRCSDHIFIAKISEDIEPQLAPLQHEIEKLGLYDARQIKDLRLENFVIKVVARLGFN